MPRADLTPRNTLTLEPGTYFDHGRGAPRGFALRVRGVSRAFYQTYRMHGRFVWYRVADATKASLSAARKEARRILALVELGRDPQREREEARAKAERDRQQGSLAALCREYLDVQRHKLAASSVSYYSWLVEKKVAGTPLGRMKAGEVAPADVERHLAQVRKDVGNVTANRVRQVLMTVCRWAVRKGRLQVNPMDAVEPPSPEAPRERVLSDAEIPYLWRALDGEPEAIRATVKLLLLLGQRSTATLEGLRWDALDLDGKPATWTIAGKYQKGGRLHVVPLPEPVVKLIKALPRTGERVLGDVDQVNYNRSWWAPLRDKVINLAQEDEMKIQPFTRHDLRRTCATGMARLGASRFVVERVLGHIEAGGRERIANIYDRHDYLPEKASALATWAAHVLDVTSGKKRRADVKAFPGRA